MKTLDIVKLINEQFSQIRPEVKPLYVTIFPSYDKLEFHLIAYNDPNEGYCIVDFYWNGDYNKPIMFGSNDYSYETSQDMLDEITEINKRLKGELHEFK